MDVETETDEPRFNIAPVRNLSHRSRRRWPRVFGTAPWGSSTFGQRRGKRPPPINAGAKRSPPLSMFRNSSHSAVLIPATGFYEWRMTGLQDRSDDKYRSEEAQLFAFAIGLWMPRQSGCTATADHHHDSANKRCRQSIPACGDLRPERRARWRPGAGDTGPAWRS